MIDNASSSKNKDGYTNNSIVFWWFGLVWFGLVSLFNGISTFVDYLMAKPFS